MSKKKQPQAMYVCTMNETPKIKAAHDDLNRTITEANERIEFLKKQLDGCVEQKQKAWTELFLACQNESKIPLSFDREKYSMSIINDDTQLIISPRCDHEHGLNGQIIQLNL